MDNIQKHNICNIKLVLGITANPMVKLWICKNATFKVWGKTLLLSNKKCCNIIIYK
jgi:hypothetical protein